MEQAIIILFCILIFNNFLLCYAFFKHVTKLDRRICELEAKYIIHIDEHKKKHV